MKLSICLALLVVYKIASTQSAAIEHFEDQAFELAKYELYSVEGEHLRQRREVEAKVDIQKQKSQGTNVNAQVGGTVWSSGDGRTKVEANGNYNRQFGGPHGSSRPNYGGNVQITHKW